MPERPHKDGSRAMPGRNAITTTWFSPSCVNSNPALSLSCGDSGIRSPAHMVLRRYRPGNRAHLRQVRRHWLDRQEHLHPQRMLGSWLFLGVMLTSVELTPDLPPPDRCGSCTRCLDACPTNAFPAPYQLDATKCISYLTIEKRGAIPEDLRAGIGRQVFGCDICQDVCPWNRHAPVTATPEFDPRPQLVNPDLEWLGRLTLEEFREMFRGSPVKRAKHSGPASQCRDCYGQQRRGAISCRCSKILAAILTPMSRSTPSGQCAEFGRSRIRPLTSDSPDQAQRRCAR